MKNFTTRLFDLERAEREGSTELQDQTTAAQERPERARTIAVDPERLASERILPAGATGPYGAGYKMLRTQVLKRLEQIQATSFAVLSPCSADGKTLTAINLAITIAAATGRTALLVDFDLRNPNIHKRFGFEPEVGVEDCIESRHSIGEALVRIAGYERLAVLPAKRRVEQSSELLSAARVGELVTEMRNRYTNRVLIFDLPPVLQADDALAFSRHIQAALLVVNERHTKRDDVTRSIELLRDTPVLGTVLNGSRARETQYY